LKGLVFAGRALLADLASTLLFLILYELTQNLAISVGVGIAVALAQIGWKLARRGRIDALQWSSLFLVIASGSATLITRDPRFVMLKPTVIYLLVGFPMMQRGWMLRYMPERAMRFVPDLAYGFGYVWAGMMFFSAALNLILALTLDLVAWGTLMSIWGTASKIGLFFLQYGIMRFVGHRRYRAGQSAMLAA
jgi:intracellular septation protein A